MRQPRSYGALHETQHVVDEQQNSQLETPSPGASREPRNYDALHETQAQVDDQLNRPAPEGPQRSWTHHGGMVPQQESANEWIRQNYEMRMAANDKSGESREEEKAQQPESDHAQDQAELQEARAAVEEARQREATERARQQERERSGPER